MVLKRLHKLACESKSRVKPKQNKKGEMLCYNRGGKRNCCIGKPYTAVGKEEKKTAGYGTKLC